MTTSGQPVLSVSRNDIITTAFLDMGAYAAGQIPTAAEISDAVLRLNMMIKAWQGKGYGLWLHYECTLPLQADTLSYSLGPSGTHCSRVMGETTLAVAGTVGVGTITVASASGITNGQFIGIELDNGSIQWTTVNGVPVGAVVTLTAVLTGAAAIGNVVYFYTSKIARPLEIREARIRDVSGSEVTLTQLSRDEYMSLPLKSSEGKTVYFYYDSQMTNAVLYLWPVNTVVSDRVKFTVRAPVETFVNPADEPHFPMEWFDALHYGLAVRLAPSYKVPANDFARLEKLASITLEDADGFDREQGTSVFFSYQSYGE